MPLEPTTTASLIGGGMSLLGGLMGSSSTSRANRENAELQREFAQHGVQWRVEDAKKAGIHPLAAMGMSPNTASPSYVGSDPGAPIRKIGNRIMDSASQRAVQGENSDLVKSQTNLNHANAAAIWDKLDPTGLKGEPHKSKWTHNKMYDPKGKRWVWVPTDQVTQAYSEGLILTADPTGSVMQGAFRDAPPPAQRNYQSDRKMTN